MHSVVVAKINNIIMNQFSIFSYAKHTQTHPIPVHQKIHPPTDKNIK